MVGATHVSLFEATLTKPVAQAEHFRSLLGVGCLTTDCPATQFFHATQVSALAEENAPSMHGSHPPADVGDREPATIR